MANKSIFNKGFFTSGKDLVLSKDVIVKHPSVEEFWNLGNKIDCEDIYWNYVNILLCDPYTNMVELDDMGIDYESQTPFDIFVLKWELSKKIYIENKQLFDKHNITPLDKIKESLIFFLGKHNFDVYCNEDNTYIVDLDNYNYKINKSQYNLISEFIKEINCLDMSYKINPASSGAKKLLIEDQRDELNRRKRIKDDTENDYIGTAIDILSCSEGSINYLNVGQYKMYQLLKSVKMKVKKMNWDHLMTGIYTGNIDSKKISKEELTWMN